TLSRVEPGGEFQGKGFVVHEAVLARHTDGALVQLCGVAIPPFDPRQLGGDERGAVGEVLRTMPSPELELPKMAGHAVHMLLFVMAGGRVTGGGVCEGPIERAFNPKSLGGPQLVLA